MDHREHVFGDESGIVEQDSGHPLTECGASLREIDCPTESNCVVAINGDIHEAGGRVLWQKGVIEVE